MENQKTQELLPAKLAEVAKGLNKSVISVIGSDSLVGFEKAYLIAIAAGQLQQALTPEYMKPIIALQGNRLGFKTDKDKTGGYSESEVKNCLIEAVLTGVQPFGNQFNIIAGNCYITKEGFGYLLKNMEGLSYEITPSLPRIDTGKGSAAIVMTIKYTYKGVSNKTELDIPVKVNSMMGADAVIGKATRKARAWLFNTITGSEVADGDIMDLERAIPIKGAVMNVGEVAEAKERDRITEHIKNATTEDELRQAEDFLTDDSQRDLFNQKLKEVA